MKRDIVTIIGINTFEGDDGTPEITADVFYYRIGIAEIGLGINIKPIFIFAVDQSFCFLERRSNAGF